MDRGEGVTPVDAAAQDAWDWEVLQPDLMSSRMSHDDGTNLADDDRVTEELVTTPPSSDGADVQDELPPDEFKDIGVVADETAKPSKEEEEEEAMPEVTADPSEAADGDEEEEEEEEKKNLQSLNDGTDTKPEDDGQADDDGKVQGTAKEDEEEEEDDIKKDNDDSGARPAAPAECVVFSVAKLIKENGIGALCSFGVAAATVCIFLIGGRMHHHHHHHHRQQEQQFYGDDKRIQQVVQQTSRLNQTMSSVMGGSGGSTRANISFGGFYDGL